MISSQISSFSTYLSNLLLNLCFLNFSLASIYGWKLSAAWLGPLCSFAGSSSCLGPPDLRHDIGHTSKNDCYLPTTSKWALSILKSDYFHLTLTILPFSTWSNNQATVSMIKLTALILPFLTCNELTWHFFPIYPLNISLIFAHP